MARSTSPKAPPAGSRASIRGPVDHDLCQRSAAVDRRHRRRHDVAFIGGTAYTLVTLVGPDVGGSDVVGIYRIDGPDSFTVVADIGAFALSNPPRFRSTSRPESSTRWRPTAAGSWSPMGTTTGSTRSPSTARSASSSSSTTSSRPGWRLGATPIYMAEAGPSPTSRGGSKVVSFKPKSPRVTEVASGAPLLVDVEFGRGRDLYALSQGIFPWRSSGAPASPNTGSLVKVNGDGRFNTRRRRP